MEEMLDENSIVDILTYFTKTVSEDKRCTETGNDPITSTLIIFMTSHIHLSLTDVGAMIFKEHSTLIYPYNLMSVRQKAFLRNCIQREEEWNTHNNTVVFKLSKSLPAMRLSSSDVLFAFCKKILRADNPSESTRSTDSFKQRMAVCNIILQRVQGHVQIDKPIQQKLNDWIGTFHKN